MEYIKIFEQRNLKNNRITTPYGAAFRKTVAVVQLTNEFPALYNPTERRCRVVRIPAYSGGPGFKYRFPTHPCQSGRIVRLITNLESSGRSSEFMDLYILFVFSMCDSSVQGQFYVTYYIYSWLTFCPSLFETAGIRVPARN
jgi:hypothetical protein